MPTLAVGMQGLDSEWQYAGRFADLAWQAWQPQFHSHLNSKEHDVGIRTCF
jgi:hypothetical protein